jgi:hypothetical protein
MTIARDPERELVRRVVPWGAAAVVVGLAVGVVARGWPVGVSAGIGLALVVLNSVASALSVSRAARVSLTVYSAVVAGGVLVRLGVIVAAMAALSHVAWFSRLAFGLAVVPGTIALLSYELHLYSRGVGRGLVLPAKEGAV